MATKRRYLHTQYLDISSSEQGGLQVALAGFKLITLHPRCSMLYLQFVCNLSVGLISSFVSRALFKIAS